MILWTGFIVCLVAQLIVFASVDGDFSVSAAAPELLGGWDKDGNHIKQCLMFIPCFVFALAADAQILVSTLNYKPVAFKKTPYKCSRPFMLTIASASLLMTIVTYIMCLYVFGGISISKGLRSLLFSCFMAKAVLWSPFLGMELYDTLFEQIYHDV